MLISNRYQHKLLLVVVVPLVLVVRRRYRSFKLQGDTTCSSCCHRQPTTDMVHRFMAAAGHIGESVTMHIFKYI